MTNINQGGKFCCCSDPPPEVVSEPQQRGAGGCWLCRSDGVHSLTAKLILHASNKRSMSHISTHKATLHELVVSLLLATLIAHSQIPSLNHSLPEKSHRDYV
uniref:Uncharacterized protein n=1 Tax=Sparus aurata TaxID=8175 RepID=A0A671VB74_SPAAU